MVTGAEVYGFFAKHSAKTLFGFFISSLTALLLPDSIRQSLRMSEFLEDYKVAFTVTLVVSFGLLMAQFLWPFLLWIRSGFLVKRQMKFRIEHLKQLSGEEKAFLSYYLANDTKTQTTHVHNGVARNLQNLGIVYPVSNLALNLQMAYILQPWVWDYLNSHPEILE